MAAQTQSLRTNVLKAKIDKSTSDATCRVCKQAEETVDHIVSGCSKFAQKEYKRRHDCVDDMTALHWDLCRMYDIQTAQKWYEHQPEGVVEKENVKILWDFNVQTDNEIQARRPDIVIHDKSNKSCYIIDDLSCKVISGNILVQISDHFPQFSIFNNSAPIYDNSSYFVYNYKNFDESRFLDDYQKMDFAFLNADDSTVNHKFDEFLTNLNHLVDKHCPKKKLNKKALKLRNKPWINNHIQRMMRIRDRILQQFKQTESPQVYAHYKLFRNRVVNEIRNNKKTYFQNYFTENKSNMKLLWKGIRSVLRSISFQPFFSPSTPIFFSLKILKLKDMIHHDILKFVYRSLNGLSLSHFHNYFQLSNTVHSHETRQAARGDIFQSIRNTFFYGLRSMKYFGAKLWNGIPTFIKMPVSFNIFKSKLKEFLVNGYGL